MYSPSVTVKVDSIHVDNEEILTVYLKDGDKWIQVELRVKNNKPEIYCDSIRTIRSFDNWYE